MSVTKTIRDIEELTPKAQKACNLFMAECKKQGLNVLITETYRSQERQNYLYAQGRTRSGKVVTWTKSSRHTSRRAWDICKNVKGGEYSDASFFKKCGEIAKKFNITWGGTWKTPDTPHFEISENWSYKEEEKVARTVMELPKEIYVQEICPSDFKIEVCDKTKKNIDKPNYFNLGFFSGKDTETPTVPVGNLAVNGKVISQSKDNGSWINVAKKKLTTIYTTYDGKCGITKTDNLSEIKNLKNAVSGIPIIVNARKVEDGAVKAEGYSGGETRDEWHGFLGIRHNKLVYVAMKCGFDRMCWALVALGIYNAIKLDGGGSFILKNGEIIKSTSENRRIHNIGIWG